MHKTDDNRVSIHVIESIVLALLAALTYCLREWSYTPDRLIFISGALLSLAIYSIVKVLAYYIIDHIK